MNKIQERICVALHKRKAEMLLRGTGIKKRVYCIIDKVDGSIVMEYTDFIAAKNWVDYCNSKQGILRFAIK